MKKFLFLLIVVTTIFIFPMLAAPENKDLTQSENAQNTAEGVFFSYINPELSSAGALPREDFTLECRAVISGSYIADESGIVSAESPYYSIHLAPLYSFNSLDTITPMGKISSDGSSVTFSASTFVQVHSFGRFTDFGTVSHEFSLIVK